MKMLETAISSLLVTKAGDISLVTRDAYTCRGCDHGTNRIPSAFSSLSGSDELKDSAWGDFKVEDIIIG